MIVRNDIKHYLHSQVNKENLQATIVTVQTSSNYFQLSAVYVPPRHKIFFFFFFNLLEYLQSILVENFQ